MSTNTETRSSTDPIPVSVNQAVDPNDKPLTIAVVDQTHDVEAAAKDYAEARLRGESEAAREAGRIKAFCIGYGEARTALLLSTFSISTLKRLSIVLKKKG